MTSMKSWRAFVPAASNTPTIRAMRRIYPRSDDPAKVQGFRSTGSSVNSGGRLHYWKANEPYPAELLAVAGATVRAVSHGFNIIRCTAESVASRENKPAGEGHDHEKLSHPQFLAIT
jgi:hypothetical protein